ncbi:vacuolar protein sorting-associated protein 54-like [Artemia franciscana]|uniref:vacuolar protein sorting-associated protein 54-like n=1 Tax=Artemia franciscana TaxID=6661 RepID=UPI0032DBEAFB
MQKQFGNPMPRNSLLGASGTDSGRWSMFMSCQNLASALSDPNKGKQKDIFTKNWGYSFTETSEIVRSPLLDTPETEDFRDYLKRISRRYKKTRKKSDNQRRLEAAPEKLCEPLESVPKIYLQANFSLKNPDIFAKVFNLPDSLADSVGSIKTFLKGDQALQEQLSHHLDCVECHLALQIGKKSESLFCALTSHDSIMADLSATVSGIQTLRGELSQVNAKHVVSPLKVLQLYRAKGNYVSLLKKLTLMATVYQAQPTIQLLLSNGDYLGALDLISTSQEVLKNELNGISSFRHLSGQLSEITHVIELLLDNDWHKFIYSDLNKPIKDEDLPLDTERLSGIAFGFLKLRKCTFVDIYRSEAVTSLQALLKQLSIEAVGDVEMDSSRNEISQEVPLAEQLKKLSFASWMTFMNEVTRSIIVFFKRVKKVHDAVQKITAEITEPSHILEVDTITPDVTELENVQPSEIHLSQKERENLRDSLHDLIVTVADAAHEKCAKYLVARTKLGLLERLNSLEFISLGKLVEEFVSETEKVLERKPNALRMCFQGQASRFVQRFHEERKRKMGLVLDGERWREAKVSAESQHQVSHIMNSGRLEDPPEPPPNAEHSEVILVGQESFCVVGATLYLLPLIIGYCTCASELRSAAPEVLARLVDLLKIFNSRACQLVLGAGALQLVGLKVISSKNLALSSRSLQLIVQFIPRIKSHFESLLGPLNLNQLRHLDQVKVDFCHHVTEIEAKLVSLLLDFSEGQLSGWDAQTAPPSPAFKAIGKQLMKMHEAIGILPLDQRTKLTVKFMQLLKQHLKRHLSRLNIVNDGGPQHMSVVSEILFFIQDLKKAKLVSANEQVESFSRDLWPT